MENLVIILVIVVLVGASLRYIYKTKKKGGGCIGCPYAKNCQGHNCISSDKDEKSQ